MPVTYCLMHSEKWRAHFIKYSAADWSMTLVAKSVYNPPISRRCPVSTLNITSKSFGMHKGQRRFTQIILYFPRIPASFATIDIPAIIYSTSTTYKTILRTSGCWFLSGVTDSSFPKWAVFLVAQLCIRHWNVHCLHGQPQLNEGRAAWTRSQHPLSPTTLARTSQHSRTA